MFFTKRVLCFSLCSVLILFTNCGKKQNEKLAINYYRLSTLELEEDELSAHNYRKSLYHIDMALQQDLKPDYLARKATLLFLLKKEEESFGLFEKLLKMNIPLKIKAEIGNNYACLLAKWNRKDKALKIFEQLEQNKDYSTPEVACVNQAKIYCDDGHYDQAEKKLLQATKIARDYVDAYYYLGVVCYLKYDYSKAFNAVEKTLFLEPLHKGGRQLRLLLNQVHGSTDL